MLHPVYFFKNNEAEFSQQHLLVQNGNSFCGFVLYNKNDRKVNTWVLYKIKTSLNEELLAEIMQQQEWLGNRFRSVQVVDYTQHNTLMPKHLLQSGYEYLPGNLMLGNLHNTVLLQDAAGEALNLYHVPSSAYVGFNRLFENAEWLHHESVVMKQTAAEDAIITVEVWFSTVLIYAQQKGKWQVLQQKNYETPEDVLYHILNCKQQFQMGDEVKVVLQGMVEENSALYNLLHQYILNLELNNDLVFEYPYNTTDIPHHTKQLIDRILTCVS
ncbi:MAG: DUF3822 family protein [Chitinophagaceae bacterium]|nr:DUF3822 family protein [Chitinophagaceae bacterium]